VTINKIETPITGTKEKAERGTSMKEEEITNSTKTDLILKEKISVTMEITAAKVIRDKTATEIDIPIIGTLTGEIATGIETTPNLLQIYILIALGIRTLINN